MRRILPLALLLLAAVSAFPESAEEFLARIEKAYMTAPTLHAKGSMTMSPAPASGGTAGVEFWFGAGNRLKCSTHSRANDGRERDQWVVCDGAKRADSEGGPVTEAAADLGASTRRMLARMGCMTAFILNRPNQALDLVYTNPAFGEDEKVGDRTVKVVKFDATPKTDQETVHVKLLVDPDSLAVLRRVMSPNEQQSISEEWAEVRFDAEIPEDTFTLPPGK